MTAGAMICGGLSSCKNADVDFPDSDGGINVYFSYQKPIRTIVLGDITTTDNSGDNEHRFSVYTTMGGAYHGRNIDVQVDIDESLVNGLSFPDGTKLEALPSSYYTLSGKTIATKESSRVVSTFSSTTLSSATRKPWRSAMCCL